MTATANPLGDGDPKGVNMAVQSENGRNKAVVDEDFKAESIATSRASRHICIPTSVTAPNYLPWGGRHVGAAFFRDH